MGNSQRINAVCGTQHGIVNFCLERMKVINLKLHIALGSCKINGYVNANYMEYSNMHYTKL